jgi:formiminotetrahydrofolate cyclodeaminase
VSVWLDELASSAPAPGGGAAAALEAAVAAALVEMVCNLTIGKPAFAEHEATLTAVRDAATERRAEALALADEDAAAFSGVIAAYRLPHATPEETVARSAEIQAALAAAAEVPRRTAELAAALVDAAGGIVGCANPNVVSDLAAAAAAGRAALASALVNVEINRRSIEDPTLAAELDEVAGRIEQALARADAVVAAVRERLA